MDFAIKQNDPTNQECVLLFLDESELYCYTYVCPPMQQKNYTTWILSKLATIPNSNLNSMNHL